METAYVVVTLVAAALVGYSAAAALFRARWVVQNLTSYGVPRSWLPWLGAAKGAGAAGLLAGLAVPVIGTLAGIGLVLYFMGAVVTVARARWYSHIPYPLMFLTPVAVCIVLARVG